MGWKMEIICRENEGNETAPEKYHLLKSLPHQ